MRFSTPDGFCASHLLDRDGAPLGTGVVGGEGDDERGARFVQGAGARTALADGVHESGELAAVRGLEALDEIRIAGAVWLRRARLDRADRAAAVDTDGDAVRAAEDLEPHVVTERVQARAGEDPERAAAEPEDGDGRVDVAVTLEPGGLPDGAVGVDLGDLLAGDVADGVEVVNVQVAEDPARAGDVFLGRRRRVVRGGADDEQVAERTRSDSVVCGTIARVEAALEADLDEDSCPLDLADYV